MTMCIDIIYKVVVKHFLLFISKFGYINRHHIGYTTGDLYSKIFFFSIFSKLLLNNIISTKWEMYDSS